RMTRSELHAVMVSGMATVSGGMLAAYIALGVDARFLLAASLVNAPAALMMAKVIVPETGKPETAGRVEHRVERGEVNLIDAAATGASAGMKLVLNVVAMLIAFLSIVALINLPLGAVGLSLSDILGWVFAPIAFLVGVPAAEVNTVAALLGKKVILNEFVAYLDLTALKAAGTLSAKSEVIATFALCGFANLGSVGIQIGGIGAIAPGRKKDLARLGLRALAGGTLATLVTAAIAGMLTGTP
ncbi:MAG: NupC/NupG family nucleoside CNT transporter, partial [Acidobacteria bacterium]|nr:NupC/NupG family nucleoside CNT transporter [Acidobacteriota bacterium]